MAESRTKIEDVVVIGAGPAGISAAVQLKRYGIEPVVFEKNEIGGLMRNASLIENYPGFFDGIEGDKLANLFKKHVKKNKIKVIFEEIIKLDYEDDVFQIHTRQREFKSRITVIASGTKPVKLSLPAGDANIKKRIYYEIYPIKKVREKKIVIVGAGDTAFDYAINMSKNNEVIILNRGSEEKCLPLLFKRVQNNKKIQYLKNISLVKIERCSHGLNLLCKDLHGQVEIYADYLIVAIGREPLLNFLSERIKKNLEKLLKKNILYMIGDVKNGIFRQIAISAGDGIRAAMEINAKFREMK